jgi:hypothetical protein
MTVETKTFIGPSDIVALDFECTKCHSHLTCGVMELDRWIDGICGNCQEPFIAAYEKAYYKEFVSSLQGLIKPALKRECKTKMRFQIKVIEE